jgi:two-component system sensor histidine kinase DegS
VDDGQLALEVRDDGRGFHVPELRVSARQPAARGMNNLHARAAILQGQLRIQSRPGTGTSIRLTVPLRAE